MSALCPSVSRHSVWQLPTMQWRAGFNCVFIYYYNDRRAGLLALHLGPQYVLDVSEPFFSSSMQYSLAPLGLRALKGPSDPLRVMT